jgi:hypothetical protein
MYETYYVTAHKGPCRAACFTDDGRLIYGLPLLVHLLYLFTPVMSRYIK